MKWLMPIIAVPIIGFYVRFFLAINQEMETFRRRPSCPTVRRVFRPQLFRLDPSRLWIEKMDYDASQIEDQI